MFALCCSALWKTVYTRLKSVNFIILILCQLSLCSVTSFFLGGGGKSRFLQCQAQCPVTRTHHHFSEVTTILPTIYKVNYISWDMEEVICWALLDEPVPSTGPPDQKRSLFCKFTARYIGPYEAETISSPSAVKLQLPSSMPIHPMFHVSQLKPVHSSL